jgi:hypothetical protein
MKVGLLPQPVFSRMPRRVIQHSPPTFQMEEVLSGYPRESALGGGWIRIALN